MNNTQPGSLLSRLLKYVSNTLIVGFVATMIATQTVARAAPGSRPVNYDAFLANQPAASLQATQALQKHRASDPHVQMEPRLGVPTFMRPAGYMARTGKKTPRGDAAQVARDTLGAVSALYKLNTADIGGAEVAHIHNTGSGPVVVTFRSRIDGIDVYSERMAVALNRELEPVAISGYLSPRALGKGAARRFRLSPAQAAVHALKDLTGASVSAAALAARTVPASTANGPRQTKGKPAIASGKLVITDENAALVSEAISFKPVLYRMPDALLAAYYMEVWEVVEKNSELWGYVISAEDGTVLSRNSRTQNEAFSYRVYADPNSPFMFEYGPHEDFAPRPTNVPDGSAPAFIPSNAVTLQNAPFSQNDPWLPAGATETTGNNVDAYADLTEPDGFNAGDVRAYVTGVNVFDWYYDLNLDPQANTSQTNAAVTQLFYTNNMLHDLFYDRGFDEAAGNAQTDNYGRGGIGGDPILAEAQDYSGLNNASMSTPADGGSPVMQMFLWSSAHLTVDGTKYTVGAAAFGPQSFSASGTVELVNDITGTSTSDGCEPLDGFTAGNIALIDRGNCTFVQKVKNAQNAGAVGVIIANNVSGTIGMAGSDASITIPSLMVSLENGNAIKALASPTATLHRDTNRDSGLDAQIVSHEWGHYLSHRLVGSLGTQQSGAMGEGWSDFMALLMTVRAGDSPAGIYPLAGYLTARSSNDPYYFGIRRMPYSTDMVNVNPLTFKHISDGVALPTGVPLNDRGVPNNAVHRAGEVWASMLWESYAALLADTQGAFPRLTFDQARTRMMDYLVAGLKLTPPNPTFIEARDALLVAAAAGDPIDATLFCQAFARRGAGSGAIAPPRDSFSLTGVVESFECGGSLELLSVMMDDSVASCDNDSTLDDGETGILSLTFRNNGGVTLSQSTLTLSSTDTAISFPDDAWLSLPESIPGQVFTVNVHVQLDAFTGTQGLPFSVAWDDPDLLASAARTASVSLKGNVDEAPSASDDVESASTAWTPGGTPATGGEWDRQASAGNAHYWHGADPGSVSDSTLTSPPLQVSASGDFSFTFQHQHDFEFSNGSYWDGGVIEISTDNGATWADIGHATVPGYNATLRSNTGNPLGGRPAFGDQSAGYPALNTVTVSLGTAYQGQSVQIRFRIGSDTSIGAGGWDIDNLVFTGIDNRPFLKDIEDPLGCATGNLKYTLSLNTGGSGTGIVTGAGLYEYETTATVGATADASSYFDSWTGPDAAACTSGSVLINKNRRCTADFTLKLPSTVTVNCPTNAIYTGTALTLCTAEVTAADGLSQSLTVSYSNNTDAGTATATAAFTGDVTHTGNDAGTTFIIDPAGSVATVNCPTNVTYSGAALTPCTAEVTAADGLSQSLTVSYSNNTDAGTATATATYSGDANHTGSDAGTTFNIDPAPSATIVTMELGPYPYRGTPYNASATVTGTGGLSQMVPVSYSGDCINVTVLDGCVASATFTGDANHTGSTDSASITIKTVPLTVTVQSAEKDYGDPTPPFTYTFDGFANGETNAVVAGEASCNTTATQFSQPGTYPIVCTQGALSAQNYTFEFVAATLTVKPRDALARYIGETTWVTSGSSDTTAQIALTASMQDPTGSDFVGATVDFIDTATGQALASGVTVSPVAGAPGTATANTIVTLSAGQYGAESYVILVRMTGNYDNMEQSIDQKTATLVVAQPATTAQTTGGGTFDALATAAGTYAGNGDDASFSVGMKYNKKGKNLQGKITLAVPHVDGVIYVKSNALSSMKTGNGTPKTATIYTKATIYKVQQDATMVTIDGNVTLRLDVSDGDPDKVGFTVLSSKDGSLYYSNQWVFERNGWRTLVEAVKTGIVTIN